MRDYEKLIVDLQKMRSTEYCVITSAPDFPAYKILREAICAIEELQASVPKWTSVEDRLPDVGQVVLTYIPNLSIHTGFLTEDGDFMHDVLKDCKKRGYTVTHWMPLPEPPKEESE